MDNWEDEEWDVRLFWLHRTIMFAAGAGQFETFLKDNFGISTKIFEPTLIDTNNIEEIFKQFCRDNKKTIITNLLTSLKKNSNSFPMLKILDSEIVSINSVLHWPELDLLDKKVTELLNSH